MIRTLDKRRHESAVLTHGVENVCRRLIRFLIGKMSLVKLQELIKHVYVEEIESKLWDENPNRSLPLTEFALLSGLDTRTLTKIRNSRLYRRPLFEERHFLEEITPGAAVLDTWCSTPPYMDEETGEPLPLPVSGTGQSFESLFNESVKSRGVTCKSLLKRLEQSGSVSMNQETGKLTLEKSAYLPANAEDYLDAVEAGFSALDSLADTVTRNMRSLASGKEPLYLKRTVTSQLDPGKQDALRSELEGLLKTADAGAGKSVAKHEDKFPNAGQMTAGVCLFYFEEREDP